MQAHPVDAPLELGWFTVCLRTPALPASMHFYEQLGFARTGGDPEHGWVTLSAGPTELTLMSFLKDNIINFRGADVNALARTFSERGCYPFHATGFDPSAPDRQPGVRAYDPEKWPAEFHTASDGSRLPCASSGDFLLADPDGHLLYFDTVPVEHRRFCTGEAFANSNTDGRYQAGLPSLGRLVLQMRSNDLPTTLAFYRKLGLERMILPREASYVELQKDGAHGFTLGFCQAPAPAQALCFICDDLDSLCRQLSEQRQLEFAVPPHEGPHGARQALLYDPAQNMVIFRQEHARA